VTLSGRRRGASTSAGVRAAVLVSLWLIGCASQPVSRPAGPRPAAESAAAPRADSRFAPAEAAIAAKHGSDYSGFNLLERSDRALLWRLTLIDSAKHSIDLQYYVWFGDTLGRLMMDRVIKSADRGVKVRILFDDLNTMLHDMTHVEMRDELLARIDRHPNIQIRVFNPWDDRSLFGRGVGMASDFKRLNRRMHNKQMVVDNRVAIIGGRNLGDEYFGLNPEFNFHDLDVLGVGPVARQASQVFDRYWNSDWVRAIPRLAPGADIPPESELSTASIGTVMANPSLMSIDAGRSDWTAEIDGLPGMLAAGRSEVHTDSPVRDAGTSNHMPNAIHHLMHSAKSELLITNAYIIPDASFMADLRELAGRGVTVRILTNSLASHDVPAVNSHYEQWREPILDRGRALRAAPGCRDAGRTGGYRAAARRIRRPAYQGDGDRPPARLRRLDEPRPALPDPELRDGGPHRQPAAGRQTGRTHAARHGGANSWQVDPRRRRHAALAQQRRRTDLAAGPQLVPTHPERPLQGLSGRSLLTNSSP
jgi:putative cardiolipin synthase